MATTAPASAGRHSSTAAAERVVPCRRARSRTCGSCRTQITRLPAGNRARITPAAVIRQSAMTGAPAASAARPAAATSPSQASSATMSGMPQACTRRSATAARLSGSAERSHSARIAAKDWR